MAEKSVDTGTIGNRIRERRKELGLSIEELALRIGYKSGASISFMENGQRGISADKLLEISDALGVDPGWLLGVQEKKSYLEDHLENTISRDQELLEDNRFQDPRDRERTVGELRFARELLRMLKGDDFDEEVL